MFAHKRVRNEGSIDCTSDVFEGPQAKISSSVDRQFGNIVLYSEQRGEEEYKNESVGQENLGVDRGKEVSVVGRIHKVERECGSRYGQQRERDFSDWKPHPEVFQQVCQKLGLPSIDLFASRAANHQLEKYVSQNQIQRHAL